MTTDRSARIAKVRGLLEAAGCPAAAFVPGPSFYYLTGVHLHLMERPTLFVVTVDGGLHALMPELERDRWHRAMPDVETVYWQDSDGYREALSALALACGSDRMGVEGGRMRHFEAVALESAFGRPVIDVSNVVAAARAVKDAAEIDLMQRAVLISEAAMEATLGEVETGMSETEIRARLMIQFFEHGADGPAFDPIVLVGAASADCHGVPSPERRLAPGDALLFDFGASFDGYNADITRTFFHRHVSDEDRRLYDTVREANRIGRAMAAPGVSLHDLDSAVTDHLSGSGFADMIRHKTGHGLGLDVHEAPAVMVNNHQCLEGGMVFTVEPGLYRPGLMGVRIEDDVVVTGDGGRSLTSMPREIRVI